MKFDEVQKYVTNIRYIFSIEPLIVSEQLFQSLSAEEQAAVLAAGQEATLASGQFLRDQEAQIKADLQAKGMEISDPAVARPSSSNSQPRRSGRSSTTASAARTF